jgi:hypothetical protein
MSESHIIFECPNCQVALTKPVLPLSLGQTVRLEDGEPAVSEGFFSTSDGQYWSGTEKSPLLNIADLTGTKYHPESRRYGGCCGRDGCDGPNLICLNGHEVGTEKSDCWTPHVAILLPNVIRRSSP